MSKYSTTVYSGDASEVINHPFVDGYKYSLSACDDKDLLALIKISLASGYSIAISKEVGYEVKP